MTTQIEIDLLFMKADGSFFENGDEMDHGQVYATHVLVVDKGKWQADDAVHFVEGHCQRPSYRSCVWCECSC